jgi:hypothetical protein
MEKWEDIKRQYPDSFVLTENPVFDGARLKEGIFRYKNKSRERVFKEAKELDLKNSITIRYTEGIRKEKLENAIFIL